MDLELSNRRALVTGASKGIGRAVASLLAAEGCSVLLAARDAGRLKNVAGEIGPSAEWLAADLADETERKRLADWAGHVDILVNVAGAIPAGNLATLSDEDWRSGWELKVFGFISLCRLVYPSMANRRTGVIINVIGMAGSRPDPEYVAGSSGNAALIAFTEAIGKASPRDGVRIVGVNPGFTLTDRARALLEARAAAQRGDAGRWTELQTQLPFGRAAFPDEIAAAVAFLASPRSGYTSGTILNIDGGGG